MSHGKDSVPGRRGTILISCLCLALVVWVSRYWHSAEFGLYEDDYTRTPAAMTMNWNGFARQVAGAFAYMSDGGKPLHSPLIYGLSILGWRLGELRGLYTLGYAILTINTLLFYALLRRLGGNSSAFLGAACFALFTADTTQALLTHSFGLQSSLTFFLIAAHAYLSALPVLPYVLALLVLLAYETPYPMLLALPLLKGQWTKRTRAELARNAVVLVFLMLVVVALRKVSGESRVGGLGFPEIVTIPLLHMVQGPAVSLGSWVYRIGQVFSALDQELVLVCLSSFVAFVFFLWGAGAHGPGLREVVAVLRSRGWLGDDLASRWLRMVVAGVALLILAYPLTFTVRAYALSGRDTRVHFAAVVGISVLFSAGAQLLFGVAHSRRATLGASAVLSVVLAFWVGFAWLVQRDYVGAWRDQQAFWSSLLPLVEDAGNGTAILVDPAGIADTRHIGGNTWNMPRILPQLFALPSEWQVPPRVYRLMPAWQDRILTNTGLFQLNGATTSAPESLLDRFESTSVILIETASGKLERREPSVRIEGQEYSLKERSAPVLATFESTELYRLLISDGREASQ